MSHEIEIRFATTQAELTRLAREGRLRELSAERPTTRQLTSLYYDTPDLALAKAGLSLRVRKIGRRHIQTVKDRGTGALASERAEHECSVPDARPDPTAIPDADVRERLIAIAGAAPLEPKIETRIRRTTRSIKTDAGDEIELAIDRGEIHTLVAGGTALPVTEIELELKQGSAGALFETARRLSRGSALTVAIESKAARGLRAIGGEPAGAQKAGRAELADDATAEEAFRATLLHCLSHIARNTSSVAQARDPEGVHQLRVGLRRLRAALTAFGGTFRVPELEAVRAQAKTLGAIFGETRELDVFSTELLAPVEAANNRPGLAELRLLWGTLHRAAWDRTADLVAHDAFTGFVLELAAAIEGRVWRSNASPEALALFVSPARDLAMATLTKAKKRSAKRARHLATLGVADRHDLRIALKRLRYSAEFFAPLFAPKPVAAFLQRLSKLQDVFGTLNDASTTETILRRLIAHAGEHANPELLEAAAFVDGWHHGRVGPTWEKAKKRWKAFEKTAPFWQ